MRGKWIGTAVFLLGMQVFAWQVQAGETSKNKPEWIAMEPVMEKIEMASGKNDEKAFVLETQSEPPVESSQGNDKQMPKEPEEQKKQGKQFADFLTFKTQ